jgi:hypothetical protein
VSDVDRLAQIIRQVDGDHSLGAGALAEALVAHGVSLPAPRQSACGPTCRLTTFSSYCKCQGWAL